MKMKTERAEWYRRYQTALRRYLKQGKSGTLHPALLLGHRAVALRLETLDLALLHERALLDNLASDAPAAIRKRLSDLAQLFFAETLVPVEKTHCSALKSDIRVSELTQTLQQRTAESSASTRNLERSIAQRQAAEAALEKSGKNHSRLLLKSSTLQNRLRRQTRAMLLAQEGERQKNSSQLHDEIAQTLLAINLRLLALKTSAKDSTARLGIEIANTQRLVRESVKRINRCAHEFDKPQKI